MFPLKILNFQIASDLGDLIKVIGACIAILAVIWKILASALRHLKVHRARQTLKDRLGAESYDRHEIRRATSCYVEPDIQSVDPSGGEDFRLVVAAREPAFKTLDRVLDTPLGHRFVIVLADSGMGKTSLLLNYYSYHWRSRNRRKRTKLALVPLNSPNADSAVSKVSDQADTVLFLDALDEDRRAIDNHGERVAEIMRLTDRFRAVVITCRTQFFPTDEEIPVDTGVLRIGPVRAGESRSYYFHKLYLAPFTDEQVDGYIRRRFPVYRYKQRREARAMVKRIPDLVARPMLLANVEDLVARKKHIAHLFEVYEEMINAWLEREKGLVRDQEALRMFSEEVALNVYENRVARKMERIPGRELEPLAIRYKIELKGWQLRGRSLLNRDAKGNYKFAHRSIMEYLIVARFLRAGAPSSLRPWTDLMKQFLVEMYFSGLKPATWAGVDLSAVSRPVFDFTEAVITSADCRGANLTSAIFRRAKCDGSDFGRADLWGANFEEASLKDCIFRASRLTEWSLVLQFGGTWSELPNHFIELDKMDWTNVRWAHTPLGTVPWPGEYMEELLEVDKNRALASLGVNIKFPGLQRVLRRRVGADLTDANTEGADFSNVDLTGVVGLTQKQLDSAHGNHRTILPVGLVRPRDWRGRRPKLASAESNISN